MKALEVMAMKLYDRHETTVRRLRGQAVIIEWGLLAEDERAPWMAVARLARSIEARRRRTRRRAHGA